MNISLLIKYIIAIGHIISINHFFLPMVSLRLMSSSHPFWLWIFTFFPQASANRLRECSTGKNGYGSSKLIFLIFTKSHALFYMLLRIHVDIFWPFSTYGHFSFMYRRYLCFVLFWFNAGNMTGTWRIHSCVTVIWLSQGMYFQPQSIMRNRIKRGIYFFITGSPETGKT